MRAFLAELFAPFHVHEGGDGIGKVGFGIIERGCPLRLDDILPAMLRRKNICSKEFVTIQYDHTVQGGHVLGPVQGVGRVQSVATLTRVLPGSKKGVGLSQGLFDVQRDQAGGLVALRAASTETMLDAAGRLVRDEPLRLKFEDLRGRVRSAVALGDRR